MRPRFLSIRIHGPRERFDTHGIAAQSKLNWGHLHTGCHPISSYTHAATSGQDLLTVYSNRQQELPPKSSRRALLRERDGSAGRHKHQLNGTRLAYSLAFHCFWHVLPSLDADPLQSANKHLVQADSPVHAGHVAKGATSHLCDQYFALAAALRMLRHYYAVQRHLSCGYAHFKPGTANNAHTAAQMFPFSCETVSVTAMNGVKGLTIAAKVTVGGVLGEPPPVYLRTLTVPATA